ncbi:MAG: (deoxy)nucleoside triphosphate pyrophosphohydrolase [Acidobacteria bacterium]|nr:(deoxy)nucleoside triphosphate pyrophosphohydrolase [Acidobacteriota bacterium]
MIRVAAGILSRGEQVLICQRSQAGAFAGKWEFPGGKLQEGESAEEALVRELAEELDIVVRRENLRHLQTLRHRYPEGPEVELYFFQVVVFQREPQNRSFQQIAWIPASQAESFDFLEADKGLVARLAAGALLPPH